MNRTKRALTCGLVAAALAVAASAEARPRLLERLQGETQAAEGGAATKTLRVGGLERSYLLLDARRGDRPAPLVVVLHGGGGNPETMMPRWADKARAEGLVIAAPKGIGRNDRMGTWNANGCCGEAVARGVDDVGFVAAVIDDVAKQVPIDRRRVYVAGFSNGGMLTHRVALALGEKVAAAAVVSGALFGNETGPRAPVPMLIIHGEKDDVVPFAGGKSPTGFVARSQTLPFLPVARAVETWRTADGCTRPPTVTRAPGVTTETSTGCRRGSEVVFIDLAEGGHAWPGSSGRRGGGEAPIDATETIWAFFARFGR